MKGKSRVCQCQYKRFFALLCFWIIASLVAYGLSTCYPRNTTPAVKIDQDANKSTGVQRKHLIDAKKSTGVQRKHLIVELFSKWTTQEPRHEVSSPWLFIYSAVVALHPEKPSTNETEIHFPVFQTGETNLTCCLLLAGSSEAPQELGLNLTTEAILDSWNFRNDRNNRRQLNSSILEKKTVGSVYRCRFSVNRQQLRGSFATLASPEDGCPTDVGQFMPVHHPEIKPGGLAVSAKVAFGVNLNPNKLVEWFEIQRILGVDKIVIYDLGNPESVYKVFRYYQDTGLLNLLPYKLPGPKWGRIMSNYSDTNAHQACDKIVEIWDSRLRLAGYAYVQGTDLDEIILPRHYTALKPFIKEQFAKHPSAAILNFIPHAFILSWEPVQPTAQLYLLRYFKSANEEHTQRKYIYRPERTHQVLTHEAFPFPKYRSIDVPTSEAAVFHYRDQCKFNWDYICERHRSNKSTTFIDRSMVHFEHDLVPAVLCVRKKLGLPDLPQRKQTHQRTNK